MAWSANVTLPPSLDIGVACEVRFVDPRIGVCRDRVCYEIAEAGVHHDDGRVGAEEKVDVRAVGI